MGKFEKIELPKPSLDTLEDKLVYLIEHSENAFSEMEIAESFDTLRQYWAAKTANKRIVIHNWNHLKGEVVALLLEDMLTNGNYQTEEFLRYRDSFLGAKSDINHFKYSRSYIRENGRSLGINNPEEANVEHFITSLEEELIRKYITIPAYNKSGLGNFNITFPELYNKFVAAFDSKKELGDANRLLALTTRMEQNLQIVKLAEEKGLLTDLCDNGAVQLGNLIRSDVSVKKSNKEKALIFQNPNLLLERLNFFGYLNSDFIQENGEEFAVRLVGLRQLTNFLLAPDFCPQWDINSNATFLDDFYYEICKMMKSETHKSFMQKVSYENMYDALMDDFLIFKKFTNVYGKRITGLFSEYPEFYDAYQKGEPFYSDFLKTDKKYQGLDKIIREEAESQLMKLFISNKFGTIPEKEAKRLEKLAEETLTYKVKSLTANAEYAEVDIEPSESHGHGGGGGRKTGPRPKIDYEFLEDPIVIKYIMEVTDDTTSSVADKDISGEFVGAFVTRNIGKRVPGHENVYYAVFCPKGDRSINIFEPIGQPNNSTFMIKSDYVPSEEAIRAEMEASGISEEKAISRLEIRNIQERFNKSGKSMDELARDGEILRVNHTGDDVESVDSANRMLLIIEALKSIGKCESTADLRQAIRNRKADRKEITLEQLTDWITNNLGIDQLPEAKAAIVNILTKTRNTLGPNISKKTLIRVLGALKEGSISFNQLNRIIDKFPELAVFGSDTPTDDEVEK